MKDFSRLPGGLKQLFSRANLPLTLMLIMTICAGFVVDLQNRQASLQAQRVDVLAKLNVVRAKLEGKVYGNFQLVRGLVAAIATEPDMSHARYDALAANVFSVDTELRNIAAAPNLVVEYVYPLQGNQEALGLDYRLQPLQRQAALRARDERKLILAGPVDLLQGGQGIIGRYPVFIESDSGERFWGLVSGVVDVDKLYRSAGLLDDDLGIEIAIKGRDGLGEAGSVFFGAASLSEREPAVADVLLPSGSWRLMAIPKNGWVEAGPDVWLGRGIMAALTTMLLIPVFVASRLTQEKQRNLRELQMMSERFKVALDASAVGVWDMNLDSRLVKWDARVHEIYGVHNDGAARNTGQWLSSLHVEDRERACRDFESAAVSGGSYSSQFRIVRPDGEIRFVRSRGIVMGPHMVGAEWDITADVQLNQALEQARRLSESKNAELELAKSRIEHNALHDPLTGLPNRRFLDERLPLTLEQSVAGQRYAAILHIDLDRFKQINDTLGHAAGDAMLVHASEVLSAAVGPGDFVARIGGDEFVILCTRFDDMDGLEQLANGIIAAMREPVEYNGHMCRFGVSVGIAVSRDGDADAKQLLINADLALYRAKRNGRNRLELFDNALQLEIMHGKMLADDLLGGLERDEFVVHYQPQFDATTLQIVGAEALVRWNHPIRGVLAPATFMKVAEELNVVSAIDRLVLLQAKRDYDGWLADGLIAPRLSVNVSARRLEDPHLLDGLRELNLPPGVFSFELVESIFLDDTDEVRAWTVGQIKALGIDIEIDDFGTGHASIVSLMTLEPKRLKIDRQLIAPVVDSAAQRELVRSIIDIGKSLGIEVVGEGVETEGHIRTLQAIGCDVLQGYAFCKPVTESKLRTFLQRGRLRAVVA